LEQFALKLKTKWSTLSPLRQRVMTASVLAPLFLLFLVAGGIIFGFIVALAAVLSYREWRRLVQTDSPKILDYTAYGFLALAVLVGSVTNFTLGAIILALGFGAVAVIAHVFIDKGDRRAPPWLCGGVLYIGIPSLCLVWLRGRGAFIAYEHDWALVLTLFVSVWATDIAAYFVGRTFGGPKLAPSISPNKTSSGLGGGVAGSAVAMAAMAWMFNFDYWTMYFFYGLILAMVAQAGDLFESFIKRRAGVKDSGALIPGHGGLLDRIDGVLTAAPVFALMVAPFM
jgi:phosphatidate cytidylyltransferase